MYYILETNNMYDDKGWTPNALYFTREGADMRGEWIEVRCPEMLCRIVESETLPDWIDTIPSAEDIAKHIIAEQNKYEAYQEELANPIPPTMPSTDDVPF
jgi:hypothetical protein